MNSYGNLINSIDAMKKANQDMLNMTSMVDAQMDARIRNRFETPSQSKQGMFNTVHDFAPVLDQKNQERRVGAPR